MRYSKKIVKLPEGMKVGSKVGVSGEGLDVFEISEIVYNKDNMPIDISLNDSDGDPWWREPLCNIYLIPEGMSHSAACRDNNCRVDVAIGECDICKVKFPDSCSYHHEEAEPNSMICNKCWKGESNDVILLLLS